MRSGLLKNVRGKNECPVKIDNKCLHKPYFETNCLQYETKYLSTGMVGQN